MKQFIRTIKSDIYKALHSHVLLIHLFVPFFGMAAFLAYYTISPWSEPQKVSAYLQVLAMVFPMVIGIVTVIVSEQEVQAASCQMLLSTPCKRYIPHFAKLLVILIFGFWSSIIAVFGFGTLFRLMGNVVFPLSLYIKSAILLFLGNMTLYILQYIVSFAFGKGVGLGLGMVGSLLSALLLTGLGDRIWTFLPWGISTRFCSMFVESKITNVSFVDLSGVTQGVMFIGVTSAILLLILAAWSTKWDGRKNKEN